MVALPILKTSRSDACQADDRFCPVGRGISLLSHYGGGMMPALGLRRERVVVETDRYRVEGDIMLPREGYNIKLTDYLNRKDQDFIVIIDSELTALDGSGRDWNASVLMLARRHIRLIVSQETSENQ